MHHSSLQEVGSTAGEWLHSLFSGAGESQCLTCGDQHLASKVQVLRLQALPLHMYHVMSCVVVEGGQEMGTSHCSPLVPSVEQFGFA
jgi:hypothetical protein